MEGIAGCEGKIKHWHEDADQRKNGSNPDNASLKAAEQKAGNHYSTAPSLECKQTTRALLDEQDDKDEHENLAKHRTCKGLKKLVGDAKCQRADQCAPEIAHAAEDDDHEAVDDVALSEIGGDVADLG